MDRVRIIEGSLACFRYGVLSFIPLVGIVPMIRAIRMHRQILAEAGGDWNPADRYLACGYALARAGCLISVVFPLVLALRFLLEQ